MNHDQFKNLVKTIKVGKKLPDSIYLHIDSFDHISVDLSKFIHVVASAINLSSDEWNIVKLFRQQFKLSFLNYPKFFDDSYPVLDTAVTIDLEKLDRKITSFKESANPPILHRKELFLPKEHASYGMFCEITEEGEKAGLYTNSRVIGFKQSWLNVIEKKGYQLVNGRLIPLGSDIQTIDDISVDRHKTALVRHELSAPMKLLAKYGFLDGDYSIFDFGCGRGDDLNELQAHGLDAEGFDLNYLPDAPKLKKDIVNLGFVINVIEDRDERIDVLLEAWGLAKRLVVVAVMLANESYISQFKPFKDGVLTSRNTFQKYYTQCEIRSFLEMTLEENAVALSPGIFAIFKDKQLEQTFQKGCYQRSYQWQQITSPQLPTSNEKLKLILAQYENLFEEFWLKCLVLGRCPANDEFSGKVRSLVGSHKRAFNLVKDHYSEDEFKHARRMKKEDLLLYFSMSLFDKHKPYTSHPNEIKRDIKEFFGTYGFAKELATELLFEIADVNKIREDCVLANEALPKSQLNYENGELHSLVIHKSYLDDLPLLLRAYVGAALKLYGDLDSVQLIKIHIGSSKLTLLSYRNFDESSKPVLENRVKISMYSQRVDIFSYKEFGETNVLENKEIFI
ncbi:MAG: DNA phosphorothioation-associated putative methyltransferase [Neptunomonas phycophila]|uniref:DNA phosphorothioation-associated putative methyltransferase n=1 Tax=Neptunomonas phycophila TaxID=1572645 RepID=UPI003B8D6C15